MRATAARPPDASTDVSREHAARGTRIQTLLRLALLAFVAAVLVTEPPERHRVACWAVVAGYLAWVVCSTTAARARSARTARERPRAALALAVDVVVLAALALVSDTSASVSWTPYVLLTGFFLLPVIAAAQLDPRVAALAVVPTAGVYLGSGLVTGHADAEPLSYVVLRTGVLLAVGVGAVLLSRLQRSRVRTIARLLDDRTALLADLTALEHRERQALAEHLHDGALQYLLAARQDLGDLGAGSDPAATVDPTAIARIDEALREAGTLLRGTLAQLHPAALDATGLLPALRDLAATAGRGRVHVVVAVDGWPEGERTAADALLLSTARELLANVVKHARASTARVTLERRDGCAVLRVSDDGRGLPPGLDLAARLREGHLGLASRRLRVEAAGGRLNVADVVPHGTTVEVRVPLEGTDAAVDPHRHGSVAQ